MSKRIIQRVALLSCIALAFPALSLAAAPSEFERDGIYVDYSDLDITTEAGAKRLYARLQWASRRACDVRPFRQLGSMRHHFASRACFEAALARAVDRIDAAELTRLHTG